MSGGGGDGGGGGGGYMFQSPESIGLGYAIAIALGLIVLLSSVLLASYLSCRRRRLLRRQDRAPEIPVHAAGGVIIPRIIFVAEDDDDEGGGVQGLDQAVINSYPKFPFSGAAKDRPNADVVCSICLCDYKDGEMLRMLPDCRHYFHLLCVDGWLRLNASCPICRTSPLPTPISTPLAEVVPLSQYPARTRREHKRGRWGLTGLVMIDEQIHSRLDDHMQLLFLGKTLILVMNMRKLKRRHRCDCDWSVPNLEPGLHGWMNLGFTFVKLVSRSPSVHPLIQGTGWLKVHS